MSKPRTPEQKAKHAANARARRKFWPSQSKEAGRERGQRKLAHIKELEAINPLHPEVIKFRTSQRTRCRKWRAANIEHELARGRKYNAENSERINNKARQWRALNPEKSKAIRLASLARHPDTAKKSAKKWRAKNPDYARNYDRMRCNSDPAYKLLKLLRRGFSAGVKEAKQGKIATTLSLLGCSMGRFMEYITAHFQPGMNWHNHGIGRGRWQLDHRKPVASFDKSDPNWQSQCFNWLNFQPLWHEDNGSKHDTYPWPRQTEIDRSVNCFSKNKFPHLGMRESDERTNPALLKMSFNYRKA